MAAVNAVDVGALAHRTVETLVVAQAIPWFAAHKGRVHTLRTPKEPRWGIASHTGHRLAVAVEYGGRCHLVIFKDKGLVTECLHRDGYQAIGVSRHAVSVRFKATLLASAQHMGWIALKLQIAVYGV